MKRKLFHRHKFQLGMYYSTLKKNVDVEHAVFICTCSERLRITYATPPKKKSTNKKAN